jgi:hypothetical protein
MKSIPNFSSVDVKERLLQLGLIVKKLREENEYEVKREKEIIALALFLTLFL